MAVGARIGDYEILEKIGAGGMSEAFRALARGPGSHRRELVIKRILPHLAEDADFIKSFVNEAKILGMLNHPNVVGVYDFGMDDGRHYLALEYLNGPSLATLMARAREQGRRIPPGVAAYLGREIGRGLMAVHSLRGADGASLNVIHRDVTPSNVMTTTAGAVKLLDFGIARIGMAAKLTQHGQIKGKAGYLAPEQITGGPIDARVDLFALGIVLHEILRLDYLFYGEGGDVATVYRIMEVPIPSLSSFRDDLPPALDAIVMKALARDPEQRYQAAEELTRDLDLVVAQSGLRKDDITRFVATAEPSSSSVLSPVGPTVTRT